MNIRFLETFVWVARLHTFKAVASKLNLTQAAFSGRIAVLENELGQQLFERGSRDTYLTHAGRTLLGYAERILDTDQALRQALNGSTTLRGVIRLGVVESIIHTWFAPCIRALHCAYPETEIELTVEPTPRLHDLLKHGAIDIALQTDTVVGDDIRNRNLGLLKMGWISRTNSSVPAHATLAELAALPLVTFPRHSRLHRQLLNIFENAGERPSRLHFVSSITAFMQFLEADIGVATLPIAAVHKGIHTGHYQIVQCEHALPDLPLVMSWRPGLLSDLTEAVVQVLLDEMQRYAKTSNELITLTNSDLDGF